MLSDFLFRSITFAAAGAYTLIHFDLISLLARIQRQKTPDMQTVFPIN